MSWERYFTDLLIKETADHSFQKYSKAQLPAYNTTPGIAGKILQVLPDQVRSYLQQS